MGISEEKTALRTRYRRERNARYIEHSFEFLATIKELESASVIASYRSYGVEPDTQALNRKLILDGKTLLLPRMSGDSIEWVQWNGDESAFSRNNGGYYDRALAKTSAFTIGLIHPDEISSEDLPREPWDIPLRAAATPDLVTRF
ncbi:MAG: hypothetical protein RL560_555 [Actinomycetota bacterium]